MSSYYYDDTPSDPRFKSYYKDKTWCESNCTDSTCHRRLTEEVWAKAKLWAGKDNPPVARADFSAKCPDYTPPD